MLAQYIQSEPAAPPPPDRNLSWVEQHLPGVPWRKIFRQLQVMTRSRVTMSE